VPTLRIAVLLALLTQTLPAQVVSARPPKLFDQFVFGLSGFAGIPVGEFKQHEDGGGGLEFVTGFQPFRRQPLILRGSAGFLMYGAYNRDRQQRFCDFFGNNCQTETVFYNSRYHNMSFFQAGPEFFATDGTWRPFVYALGGVTFFNSWAHYGANTGSGVTPSRSLLSTHNASSAYGLGVRRVTGLYGREGGWEFALRFTRNAKARYLNDDGVTRNPDGSYSITPRDGAANVLSFHIGYWGGPFVNWNER
jgi:hypothetical protein